MQELIEIIKRHVRKDGFGPTSISGLEVVRSSAPSDPVRAVHRPSLCYVLQGGKEVSVAGRTFRYTAGQYLVSSVDLPLTGEIIDATPARPYLCLVVSLSPALIYDVLQSTTRSLGVGSKAGLFVGRAEPALSDAMARLARCLDSRDDGVVLVPGIMQEIVYRLLLGPFGPMIGEMGMAGS